MLLPPVVMRGTCVGSQCWATRFLRFSLLVASRAINLTEEARENPRVMVLRPTNSEQQGQTQTHRSLYLPCR